MRLPFFAFPEFFDFEEDCFPMDSSSLSMIAAIVLLICLSAYFSATETAFSSFNKIRMKNKAENGDAGPP